MALKPIPPREEPPVNSGIPMDVWREMERERFAADTAHHKANPQAWGADLPPRHDEATQAVFDAVNADNAAQEAEVQRQADAQLAEIDAALADKSDPDPNPTPKRGPGRPRKYGSPG